MFPVRALVVIFVAAVLHLDHASAAQSIQLPADRPAHLADTPGCYSLTEEVILPFGDTYPKGRCAKDTCVKGGEITTETCSPMVLDPNTGCRFVEDLSLRYPECCGQVECDQKE